MHISFDCLPLRSVGRMDIPLDASPAFRERCERIKAAIEKHGTHNSYYLYNANCTYQMTNDESRGMLRFSFEGTLLTQSDDLQSTTCDLDVHLEQETCDWLTESVVSWFSKSVAQAVLVEFDRYIAAGDLAKSIERASRVEKACMLPRISPAASWGCTFDNAELGSRNSKRVAGAGITKYGQRFDKQPQDPLALRSQFRLPRSASKKAEWTCKPGSVTAAMAV